MAVSVSPIKIISDLGYDPVDIESDEDYLSALMEATNTLSIDSLSKPGRSDARIKIIQDEVRRIRADRKAADPKFKARKTKINIGSFLGRDEEPQKLLGPSKDKQKKTAKDKQKKTASGGLVDTINVIAETVGRIENTLKDQTKIDVENSKLQKETLENQNRENQESRLEKVTGVLKKAGDKIIAPVQSILGQLFGFIKKLILGKIFLNILKWFGNPANQGKIDSVIKFLGNNWGKLLSLYLVFGTGLGRFIRFISKTLITGTIKLVALAAKLAAAKKIKGARGILRQVRGVKGGKLGAALNIIGTGAAVVGMGKMFQGGGGEEEPQKFNKGGKVRGQGDKDTVPAMLTPGEFVMSKGAVQQYGIDTMEGMNAAAGGTNIPVMMPDKKRKGYNEGGIVNRIQPEDLIHVNNERKLQGLPPLDKLTYAAGVTPSVRKGPGAKTSEYTDTHTDLETMVRTITKTVNGETTRESIKLSNEEAEAVLKEKGYPSMKLADGSVVIDSAAFNYDRGIKQLASWRARMAEENPKVLAEFNALPDVIAMDQGIEDGSLREKFMSTARMHKSGTKENLMQKNMNRIEEMDGGEGVKLMNFNGGGLVQYFNRGGLVKDYKALKMERSRLQRDPDGRLTGKNRKKWNQLSSQMQEVAKQIRNYDNPSGENQLSISNKSQKNPTNFLQPQGFGSNDKRSKMAKGGGLGRLIGGAADMMTGGLFDFDNRSGGGLLRKVVGGAADAITGNRWDFDNQGKPAQVAKSKPKHTEIAPPSTSSRGGSSSKPKVTSINAGGVQPTIDATNNTPIPEVPAFSATLYRSLDKIKTLGIMV